MEAWKPSGTGQLSVDLDSSAMADLVMRSRSVPTDQPAQQFTEDQVELRIAESTAHLREDSRIKDQFLAMLSHELRTPLMPALVALDSLMSRADLPADVREMIDLVARNVRLEARLVDDLLDLTRLTRAKLRLNRQLIDAHTALRHALEVCAAEISQKQLHVRLATEASRAAVLADSARLQQVFWNLIENAVKFTPAGGTITCGSSNESDRLKIEIIDSGVGIDPDLLPRIFDAFEQGGHPHAGSLGGLGLGLAIARGIVEAHGGTLTASSRGKGFGSTFTVEVPLAASTAPADDTLAIDPVEVSSNGHLRILLVEDHADTLRVLERLLQDSGYRVTTAQDVKTAIDELNRQVFDVLISDISLPDGSGQDLMKRAAERPELKGIALTGHATEAAIKSIHACGFAALLNKPIDFARLKETIDGLAKA